MTAELLIRGGRLVDPAANRDGAFDLVLREGAVAAVGERLSGNGAEVLDATGLLVFPGFIDLHAHLREPGREYAETIASGAAAAAAGGFTTVCAMPNTEPANDDPTVTAFVAARGREAGAARVYPVGALTRGRRGEELAEYGEMQGAGAVALSDDGDWLADGDLLRRAIQHAALFGLTVVQHAEDRSLSRRAPMHEGAVSTRLGLEGQPEIAEASAVARDLLVARLAGGRLHLAHLSTSLSIEFVREAKRRGLQVTCEATPHHLTLTDDEVARSGYSTRFKMNPPLRESSDVAALVEALADGTLDVIATDHAPHHADEKAVEFDASPFGVVGLETAAAVIHDRLVATGRLSLSRFAELFSAGPARAFRLPGGTLAPGSPADVTVFDPVRRWTVDPARFVSRSKSTPFAGWDLVGAPVATVVGGSIVWSAL